MLKFTTDHEWLRLDGEVATVGITDFAQDKLGDLVFVELPKIGAKLKKGAATAVVESVKAASDVYAPVSGEVIEVNAEVGSDPSLVNSARLGARYAPRRTGLQGDACLIIARRLPDACLTFA